MRKITLTQWIFIALVLGILIGLFLPSLALNLKPIRSLFLNGIKCIVAPLIFSTIVTGIAGSESLKQLGRVGLKAFIYFEIATTLALVIGLLVVNFIKPGLGLNLLNTTTSNQNLSQISTSNLSFHHFIEHLLPSNFFEAVVRGDVLQIVIFSTLFAIATLMAGEKAKPVLDFSKALAEVMFKFTSIIMLLAPFGVGAAMAASIAEHGIKVIIPLFKLVGSLYIALIIFVFTVLIPVLKIYKIPILKFFKQIKDAIILAFATTSSESAYPLALNSLEKFGVPRKISSFVLPMGYSFNLDGSTLYLAMASIFISQAANQPLSIAQQITLLLTLMLTTKGVAAVPRASLVVLSATLTQFGLPLEGIALILGVDEFMDMARTAVNLTGNCVATVVIAKSEDNNLTFNN
jgi:proton glutamate symport protein